MSQPNLFDILHLESRYPICDRICSYLSIDSIIALTRTCRRFSTLYQSLLPSQWNVDRHLQRFVQDPQFFRSQMGKHNAVVSGSVAVQFFERVLWKDSDLDIYIQQGPNAEAFGEYLIKKEEYEYNKASEVVGYKLYDIEQVLTFIKKPETDSAELKIQIILTRSIPVRAILSSFYSTVVMNIITWNKAYALFPLPTFIRHKGYLLKPASDYLSPLLQKYSRRGWRFQGAMWPEEKNSNQPIQPTRRIGDKFTWMIPFDTTNVTWSMTPDFVLECGVFDVDMREHEEVIHYGITATDFVSDVLKYRYLFGNISGKHNWMRFLGARVDELTVLELYKMDPAARPPGFQNGFCRYTSMYDCMMETPKPDSWTYYDEEVPGWYQVWRQSVEEKLEEKLEENYLYNTRLIH